jgi:hypothetical protein
MLKTCVTTIDLPAGFEIDALPAAKALNLLTAPMMLNTFTMLPKTR